MFPIFQTSDSMLAVILCMVAAAFWAQRFKPLKLIGPALLIIITGIILVNLNIVTGSCELYGCDSDLLHPPFHIPVSFERGL